MNTTQLAPTPTELVANRLFELCNSGKFQQAMSELYADNARHVEAMEFPGSECKRITEGKDALTKMSERWNKTTTVHSAEVSKPLVNGDQFVCEMTMDCTSTEGPMANQRLTMKETCLYTVKNNKITEAKFFYSCG
ncbi:MAG: nuclear transport factor 2 family protein [Deltaproteobacteria bacterium]|nr:nuclear transport factor 2 family protein [Deltaproteobacteria bacterium]